MRPSEEKIVEHGVRLLRRCIDEQLRHSGCASLVLAMVLFDIKEHAIPRLSEIHATLGEMHVSVVRMDDDIIVQESKDEAGAGGAIRLTADDHAFLYRQYCDGKRVRQKHIDTLCRKYLPTKSEEHPGKGARQ